MNPNGDYGFFQWENFQTSLKESMDRPKVETLTYPLMNILLTKGFKDNLHKHYVGPQ